MCLTMHNQFGVEYMDAIFTIIKQDLEVVKKAIEVDNLEVLQYVGNRIMMNLMVSDEIKLMLLGYMMRELGGELRKIKLNRIDIYPTIKIESISYLNDLQAQIENGNIDPKFYLDKFTEIELKLRKNLLLDIEGSVYDEQAEFAKQFSIKLLDIFNSRKQDLKTIRNLILMSSYELGRNFNQHGGKEALVIYLVFKVLLDYSRYLA